MPDKVIITAAITGAVTSRADTPHLPMTKAEIAAEAARCAAAGAGIIHIHLRDAAGHASLGADFVELVGAVREQCQALICLSTSSWGVEKPTTEQRVAGIVAQPDLVTFHVGSFNRGEKVFLNPPEYIERLALAAQEQQVKPEFELFDLGQLYRAQEVHQRYQFPGPFYVQFVLGVKGGCPAEPRHLLHLVESLPLGTVWSVAAVGKMQLPLNLLGLTLGGQVRTGLEDNVYLHQGELALGNAPLVERLAGLARELGREPATPQEARVMLGIKPPAAREA